MEGIYIDSGKVRLTEHAASGGTLHGGISACNLFRWEKFSSVSFDADWGYRLDLLYPGMGRRLDFLHLERVPGRERLC